MRITSLDTVDAMTDLRVLVVRRPPCVSARACWASSVNSTGPLVEADAPFARVTSFVNQFSIANTSNWIR